MRFNAICIRVCIYIQYSLIYTVPTKKDLPKYRYDPLFTRNFEVKLSTLPKEEMTKAIAKAQVHLKLR